MSPFEGLQVVVLGEPVLDRYLVGTTERISREAPVLIVQEEAVEARLGGAANAAANAKALGAQVRMVGQVGGDAEGREVRGLLEQAGIEPLLSVRDDAVTLCKTRILAGALHTRKQQMLRIDRGRLPWTDAERSGLQAAWTRALQGADVIVVSDYGDGACTGDWARWARSAASTGRTVVVDSRYALDRYGGVRAVTPNQPEAEAALGRALPDGEAALEGAETLMLRLQVDGVVLTRGREGLVAAASDGTRVQRPAEGGDAIDVTGAGDTVTAVVALGLAAGWSWTRTVTAANRAAGRVVRKLGAATCTWDMLQAVADPP